MLPPIPSCQGSYFEDPAVEFIFTFFALTFSCAPRTESPEREALVGILDSGPLRPKRELGEGTLQNVGPGLSIGLGIPACSGKASTECHM